MNLNLQKRSKVMLLCKILFININHIGLLWNFSAHFFITVQTVKIFGCQTLNTNVHIANSYKHTVDRKFKLQHL